MLPLVGRVDAAFTFIHVNDVVRAIVAALEEGEAQGTFFLGHHVPVTPLALLEGIQAASGRKARVLPVPMPLLHGGALVCELVGRIVGRPMPLNLWRYAELASEGFVCRVDRMRELLGVTANLDIARRARSDGCVVQGRGLAQAMTPMRARAKISSAFAICCGVWAAEQLARSTQSSREQPGGTIRFT